MNKLNQLLLALTLLSSLSACWDFRRTREYPADKKVWGYRPIYSNDSSLLSIKALPPQPVKLPGKIYVKGPLLFQNEQGMGIHVLDKTDPNKIVNQGFIRIRGNTEMTFKGSYLYANSFTDMLVIDVSNPQAPVQVSKIKDAFRAGALQTTSLYLPPPAHGVRYECIDYNRGIHTGWTQDSIPAYSCYYN